MIGSGLGLELISPRLLAIPRLTARTMEIIPASPNTQPAREDYFTGRVWLDEIAAPAAPSRMSIVKVTFEPGARTAWHTHPIVQILHVLHGVGIVQLDGEPARLIRPGDTVRILAGERHWHGAAPDQLFVHFAAQEAVDGVTAKWEEKVSDEHYATAAASLFSS